MTSTLHGDDGGDAQWPERIWVATAPDEPDALGIFWHLAPVAGDRESREYVPKEQADHLEGERDDWKRAANGDRDGLVSNEYHVQVVRSLVAERKAIEAAEGVTRERREQILYGGDRLTTDPNDPSPSGGGGEGELANEERSDVKAVSSRPSELREALGELVKEVETGIDPPADLEQEDWEVSVKAALKTARAALATEEER